MRRASSANQAGVSRKGRGHVGVGQRWLGQWAKTTCFAFEKKKISRVDKCPGDSAHFNMASRQVGVCACASSMREGPLTASSFSAKSNSNFSNCLLLCVFPPPGCVCVCVLSLAVYFVSSKAPICLPKITSNVLTFMHCVWASACQDTVMVRCN